MPDVAIPSGNYISLFAGAAGLDLALAIIGGTKCCGYVEIGIEAAEVLVARIKEGSLDDAPIWSDVTNFPTELYRGNISGVCGGWPCPPVSVAGQRKGTEDSRWLWPQIVRVLRETDAEWFVGENVAGLLSANDGGAFGDVLRDLADLRFDVEWMCLRASDVGASHGRNRVWLLAHRQSGGLGILREPSRRNGLADGSQPELVHAHLSVSEARGSVAGRDETGSDSCAGGSVAHTIDCGSQDGWSEGRGPVRNTGDEDFRPEVAEPGGLPAEQTGQLADSSRDERNGPHRQTGPGWGICEASDRMADAGSSQWWPINEPGGCGSEGELRRRQEAGTAGIDDPILSDTRHLQHERGAPGGRETQYGTEYSCGSMADTGDGLLPESWRGAEGGDGSGPADEVLADAEDDHGRRRVSRAQAGTGAQERERSGNATGYRYAELPLFAPGPGARDEWQRILRDYPYLAPAISTEEIESILCGNFDGRSIGVDIENRTDRLRALGNMVSPLQASVALTLLARRLNP